MKRKLNVNSYHQVNNKMKKIIYTNMKKKNF